MPALESVRHHNRFRSHGITAVCDDIARTTGKLATPTNCERQTARLIVDWGTALAPSAFAEAESSHSLRFDCQGSASALKKRPMNACAALDQQIKCYREMTGEERLSIALDLHELSCDIAREGIRHAHPGADPAEVERLLRRRLELARAR